MSDPRLVNLEITAPLFRVRRGLRVQFRAMPERPEAAQVSGSAIARNLALGHRLVRAVENGEVGSFAELARTIGASRAWVSMLVELTFLAPDLQKKVLQSTAGQSLRMAGLLKIARIPDWKQQNLSWEQMV